MISSLPPLKHAVEKREHPVFALSITPGITPPTSGIQTPTMWRRSTTGRTRVQLPEPNTRALETG